MTLFSVSGLKKEFGERCLFQNVAFSIDEHDRIGLVGKNGSGKTTLFKILLDEIRATDGEIYKNKQTAIGYLEQHTNLTSDKTVLDEVLTVYEDVLEMERELQEIADTIHAGRGDTEVLTRRQQMLLERYAEREGYQYQNRAKSSLLGLGFRENELSLPFAHLSGGQKTRVALCKLLLSGANLLLLDEPTNHLDLKAIEWLEGFLRDYRGAFCLISHDRYFLDKVCNKIFALEHNTVSVYSGNYTTYLKQKEENEKTLVRKYENTQKEIKRLEGIVKQQRQWNREKNIKTAESKMKMIARLEEELVIPPEEERALSFSFAEAKGGGQDVLKIENVSMAFSEKQLFSGANLHIKKGDRVFLLGPNGCGKTTLFKLILHEYAQTGGEITLGANISVGYYDQTQSDLSPGKTIFEEICDAYPSLTQTEVRNALAAFLFRGEDVFAPIGELSGGERARVSLVKLMLSGANFLLLDEPTNHLDIASREALEEALLSYGGTYMIVSHDRYFINRLAESVCYMEPTGLSRYIGNYDDFAEKHVFSEEKSETVEGGESAGRNAYEKQKQEAAKERKLASERKKTEEHIETLEQEIEAAKEELLKEETYTDYEKAARLSSEIEEKDALLLELYEKWEELQKGL